MSDSFYAFVVGAMLAAAIITYGVTLAQPRKLDRSECSQICAEFCGEPAKRISCGYTVLCQCGDGRSLSAFSGGAP